jgi:hypothetical protein
MLIAKERSTAKSRMDRGSEAKDVDRQQRGGEQAAEETQGLQQTGGEQAADERQASHRAGR